MLPENGFRRWLQEHVFLANILLALLYWLAVQAGFELAEVHQNVSPLWPPSGLALAAIAFGGPRMLAGIFVGALSAHVLTDITAASALLIAIGNSCEAYIGWILLVVARKLRNQFRQYDFLAWVLGCSIIAPLPASIIGVSSLTLWNSAFSNIEELQDLILQWWAADSIGILVITPLLLYLRKPDWSLNWFLRASLLTLLCCSVFTLIFFHPSSEGLLFIALPLLLVACRWFGASGCAFVTFGFVAFSAYAASWGHAGASDYFFSEHVLNVEMFILALVMSSFVISSFQYIENSRLPLALFLIGWAVSGILYYSIQENSNKLDNTRFSQLVGDVTEAVEMRLDSYTDALISAAGLYVHSKKVERREWRNFVEQQKFEERYPGINGIGFILPVKNDEVNQFVSDVRSEGVADFEIKSVPNVKAPPPDSLGYEHYIITFIEPLESNKQALGLNVASEINRQKAGAKARDLGIPKMTDRITLVQDGKKRPGFFIYYPMYEAGAPVETVKQRQAAFIGWSYASFVSELFFESILKARSDQIDFAVFDDETIGKDTFVFCTKENEEFTNVEEFEITSRMNLAGETFSFGWKRGESFNESSSAPAILTAGSLALGTCFLIILVVNYKHTAIKANLMVEERTAELQSANNNLRLEVYERKKAEALAEEASRAKSNFLATMSHEIRTPMNSVLGFTELLQGSDLNSEQRLWTSLIATSGNSLLNIINDILDFSKIEAGMLNLERIPFSLDETIKSVTETFNPIAAQKGLVVDYRKKSSIPTPLVGDPQRIRQVITNLVSNAIKFTDKGSVIVEAECKEGDQVNTVMIRIIDTGIGIPKKKTEELFEQFTQADNSTTRRYGGTGLGLAICKRILEAMDGSIKVESELGKGSTFSAAIPFKKDLNAQLEVPRKPDQFRAATEVTDYGLSALLVDDNNLNKKLGETVLKRLGCKVTLAGDGIEALDWLKRERFDLIFLDCQMPVLDGYDTTKRIREFEASGIEPLFSASKPYFIVALTANASEQDRQKCFACGMSDYIRKPIKIDDFKGAIDRFLRS